MRRDLDRLAGEDFDIIVIGGGATGAAAAWDASLRGFSVALIDAGDFGGGTSANCLKIVHGGLRYLQSMNVRRMRGSIGERSFWLRAAPHLVAPLPVVIGTYPELTRNRVSSLLALKITDLLGLDRNRDVLPSRRLPPSRIVGVEDLEEWAPELPQSGARAGALFYDGIMFSAERLVLELVLGAVDHGATVANHVRYVAPILRDGRLVGITAKDELGNGTIDIRARSVINAGGPAAGEIARSIVGSDGSPLPPGELSMAVNLVLEEKGEHSTAFALRSSDLGYSKPGIGQDERRELFFVPWRGRLLAGTGHYPWSGGSSVEGDLDSYRDLFLQEVNDAWPGPPFTREDVRLVHAGLLPLEEVGPEVRLATRRRVRSRGDGGIPNLVTVVGVKYTTARLAARDAVDRVLKDSELPERPCRTGEVLLPGGEMRSVEGELETARAELREALDEDVIRHLVRSYGCRWRCVQEMRQRHEDWKVRVLPGEPVIRGQFHLGAEEESAVTAEDLVWRRTELGPRGLATERVHRVAEEALRNSKQRI